MLINGEKYESQENNKLVLNKIGIKLRPLEKEICIGNNIFIKITLRILNRVQESFYSKRGFSPKRKEVEGPISFLDRIKMFSGGKISSNSYRALVSKEYYRESTKSFHVQKKLDTLNTNIADKDSNKNLNFQKKQSTQIIPNSNYKIDDVQLNIEKKETEILNDNENKEESIENINKAENVFDENAEKTIENENNEEEQKTIERSEPVEEIKIVKTEQNLDDEQNLQNNLENNAVKDNDDNNLVNNNQVQINDDEPSKNNIEINDNQELKSEENLINIEKVNEQQQPKNRVKEIINLINSNISGKNNTEAKKKLNKEKNKVIIKEKGPEIIENEKAQEIIENEEKVENFKDTIQIDKTEEEKNQNQIESPPPKDIKLEEKIENENILKPLQQKVKIEKIENENISEPPQQNVKIEKIENENIFEPPQQNEILEKCKTEKINLFKNIEDIMNEEEEETEEKEYFLEGITYDKYLSNLASQKKKEHEINRETFCEGFFIASFPHKDGNVIENSQSFPSPCGHSECSILPAMKPEIIFRYPLEDTKNLELNNLAATICFPTGIKVCYSEENPSMIKDYVTPITNQKGERYYMMTFHFYNKIMNDLYSKQYEMHPLKHHLMKFGDSYLNMSEEEMDETITNQIQESLEKSQELGFREYVYVPYCICLISKYRYVTEMKKCLQSIFNMIINNLADNKLDLNNLIMYLIHSVPIPERNTKVKFFIPYCPEGIELDCPKVQDISVMNTNISSLLKYFSIDRIIIIFRLMLFEKKILFIDEDYTRLSLITDSFISLLYPFQWVHTYIPIMSDQMLKYLETFLPFINGINSSLMNLVSEVFINNENEDSEEVFLVYINKDKLRLGSTLTSKHRKKYKYIQENVPTLPSSMEKELRNKLKKMKDEFESLLKNQKDKKVDFSDLDFRLRNVFIDMFVQMFHDYYKYMTFLDDDVVFNKNLFLEKITNNNDKHFYDEFIDTQLFQQFTQNIIKDELNYFTTMATHYDPNKKETLKRALQSKFKKEKHYIIRPDYLHITLDNSKEIEEKLKEKYEMSQHIDEEGIIDPSSRILLQVDKIRDENYNNQNCYIYTLPESLTEKKEKPIGNENTNADNTEFINKENLIYKALQSLKLKATKSFTKKGIAMTEKEKDSIKETIKDFTVKIFKSEEIEEDPNMKKELQNALNNAFGREFFVTMLSKNVANIILLKEKSFQLLGTLIYNSLLFILNIEETNKIMEQMAILIRSTKYFGQEIKGSTITLWDAYKARIQGYSKINQANFWNKWYELEIKKEEETTNLKKEKIILEICDIMISLELTKSFVKNVTHGLSEKEFGKETEQYNTTVALITEKIINTKYISKAH